jgi:aryl-alcohol dehydrogenase-like predicted oxidoreductase
MKKRPLGKTGDELSLIGFGGIIVRDTTPKEADQYVGEAIDRGVNYFDVAPLYGNAQERLGPALKPYRDQHFLACKTLLRDATGAHSDLENSLRTLQTDHFDLYQLHGIPDLKEAIPALAVTLSQPITAALPPGHIELFRLACDALDTLGEPPWELKACETSNPLFST